MTIPHSLDGFDVRGAVGRMLDQPNLWWQALGLFVEHFSAWEQAWQASIGDDAQECRKVHAVGSAAANVGADRLASRAATVEQGLRQRLAGGAADELELARQQLQAEFRQSWQAAADAWRANTPGPGGHA
jgi:HPt (histidine-containing phosphotransfer) domain-containing protein